MNTQAVKRALSASIARAELKFLEIAKTDDFQATASAFKDLLAIQACRDALRGVEHRIDRPSQTDRLNGGHKTEDTTGG